MNRSDFEQRLLDRLRASGRPVAALGIDLGTTKTCVAVAAYDPRSRRLRCECLPFEQPDGSTRAAVPSAVAIEGARTLFGADALAKRGQRGFPAESKLFYETKNDIGLRYTYARAPGRVPDRHRGGHALSVVPARRDHGPRRDVREVAAGGHRAGFLPRVAAPRHGAGGGGRLRL
jgi:molecular chaperone DnaK